PFLLQAESSSDDPEAQRRAYLCRQAIRNGPGPDLPLAAARLLAMEGPTAESVAVLLSYLPFADNEAVAEEVHNALTVLAVRGGPPLRRRCSPWPATVLLPRRAPTTRPRPGPRRGPPGSRGGPRRGRRPICRRCAAATLTRASSPSASTTPAPPPAAPARSG